MKRFVLFAGKDFYADGGWADFVDFYSTQQEAETEGRTRSEQLKDDCDGFWWHVCDLSTGTISVTG